MYPFILFSNTLLIESKTVFAGVEIAAPSTSRTRETAEEEEDGPRRRRKGKSRARSQEAMENEVEAIRAKIARDEATALALAAGLKALKTRLGEVQSEMAE
jgi:hypothetical protein